MPPPTCAQQLSTTKAALTKAQADATALSTQLRTCNTEKAALTQKIRWGRGAVKQVAQGLDTLHAVLFGCYVPHPA